MPIRERYSLYFKKTANHFFDLVRREHQIGDKLQAENTYATTLKVSATMVRNIIAYAREKEIVAGKGRQRYIHRLPTDNDHFPRASKESSESERVENAIIAYISSGKLSAHTTFSELELSKKLKTNTIVVREALLRLQNYGIASKENRKRWKLEAFTKRMMDEIIETRLLIEKHSLEKLFILPRYDPIWKELENLYEEHCATPSVESHRAFNQLDYRLHRTLLSAADNRFLMRFLGLLQFLINLQLRIDESVAQIALDQHKAYLQAILQKDKRRAFRELELHLETAQKCLNTLVS